VSGCVERLVFLGGESDETLFMDEYSQGVAADD
jgi:hypothetical protein